MQLKLHLQLQTTSAKHNSVSPDASSVVKMAKSEHNAGSWHPTNTTELEIDLPRPYNFHVYIFLAQWCFWSKRCRQISAHLSTLHGVATCVASYKNHCSSSCKFQQKSCNYFPLTSQTDKQDSHRHNPKQYLASFCQQSKWKGSKLITSVPQSVT